MISGYEWKLSTIQIYLKQIHSYKVYAIIAYAFIFFGSSTWFTESFFLIFLYLVQGYKNQTIQGYTQSANIYLLVWNRSETSFWNAEVTFRLSGYIW